VTAVALLVSLAADDVAPLVELAGSLPAGHQPVVVTSSTDWAPLRQAGLQWEYLLPPGAWDRLEHDRTWTEYAAKRLRSLVRAWAPTTVLHLDAGGAAPELAAALLPPADGDAPAPPKVDGELEALRRRMRRLEERHARLAAEQERRALADAVDDLLARRVPEEEAVAVISRGDPLLTRCPRAGHFPRDESGGWAGYYPADGDEAVSQVEALVEAGTRHLLVPPPAAWWLEHYPALRAHLETSASVVADGEAGMLFRLGAP
jgi:hypothetical protein